MGVSPATGPTPNKGYEAAAMQRVGLVVKQMTDMLPLVGATSDLGQALMKAISSLAKHVPPGSTSQAQDRNSIDELARKNAQQAATMQQMRPGGPPGVSPGGPPPGAGGGMPAGMGAMGA